MSRNKTPSKEIGDPPDSAMNKREFVKALRGV